MTVVVAVRLYEVYGRSQATTLKHGGARSRACFERGNGDVDATSVKDSLNWEQMDTCLGGEYQFCSY
jgi:hypothetical protein